LQSQMIAILQVMLNGGKGGYSSLLSTSDRSRQATILALGAMLVNNIISAKKGKQIK